MPSAFLLIILLFQILIAGNRYGALPITSNWLFSFYKRIISPLQGKNVCNFSPTCSQFSWQAINKYGFPLGLVMTADRLLRCNPSAWQYLGAYYYSLKDNRIFDPPENHYLFNQSAVTTTSEKNAVWLEPNSVQNFADYLFRTGDFARARAEYKRLFFLTTNKKIKQYAQLMIGESYLANQEFNNGLLTFFNLDELSLIDFKKYNQARCYFGLGEYRKTRELLFSVQDTGLSCRVKILTGWSYFKEKKFVAGANTFTAFANDSLLKNLTDFNGKDLTRRSRLLSTTLSTILPGLGQIYSGRVGDGLYSLLTIATTATLSYYYWQNPEKDQSRVKFSLFAFLTGLFWAGNIYGANIAARDYNEYQIRRYLTQIECILNSIDLQPDYRFLLNE